jgi:hypothetical protein
MDFLTKPYILRRIDLITLDTLTEEDDTELDDAEIEGIEEMTGYLNIRYNVTEIFNGTTKSSLIKMYLRDIMIYHLHAKVSPDNIPTLRIDRYNSVKTELEKLADGFTSPNLPSKVEGEKLPLRSGNSSEKQNHYY